MNPRIIFCLCLLLHVRPRNCESNESETDEQEQISDFMGQMSHESFDNSEESVTTLKKVVKRLARENNGQSGFQVFFGNEQLLKEWLMGAAVTGQPGVDFPTLTTIPTTAFSCRGVKGGYYADLETNCQVFHICDNGRKISFLCPNGTIFQQSQLICDWWFKVDCNKSTELYEQSAEQLAEDERKRADAKRINSEFRRQSNDVDVGQKYYRTSKSNYDGKQNGRTNPYGNAAKNQLTETEQRPFDPNQIYSLQNSRTNNQFSQINDLALVDGISNSNVSDNDETNNYTDSGNNQNNQNSQIPSTYQSPETKRNQLTNNGNSGVKQQYNYDHKISSKYSSQLNRYQGINDYNHAGQQRNGDRGRKYKTYNSDEDDGNIRATPLYTETTTFRTSTPTPIKEYQQLAESAAFATARGNRVNKPYSNTHFNYRTNEVPTAASTLQPSTANKSRIVNPQFSLIPKKNLPVFPHSTFAPIYKPRTTIYDQTTLNTVSDSTKYNKWERQDRTTTTEFDQASTTPYSIVRNYHYSTTYPSTSFTDEATETQEWVTTTPSYVNTGPTVMPRLRKQDSPEQFTSQRFSNTEFYNDNTLSTKDYSRSSYTTPRFYINSQSTREKSVNLTTSTESYNQDYENITTNFATDNVTLDHDSVRTTKSQSQNNRGERNGKNRSGVSRSSMRSWQNFRQNSINPSTEKSTRVSSSSVQQNSADGKTLKPYDTSFTYKQGKVMSTIMPYIPFTKNYAYTTTKTTTLKPPVYTATIPTYTTPSSQYRQATKMFNTIDNITPSSINGPRRSSTYLPDIKSDISLSSRTNLNERPAMERQHALNMLQSLRELDGTVPTAIGNGYGNRSGLKIPHSSSPATLHSLALYFSTAGDTANAFNENHNSNQTDLTKSKSSVKSGQLPSQKNQTVEFPANIFTQHTIKSYADLFNLNNALEVHGPANTDILQINDDESGSEEIDNEDLDLQQSEGPLDGAKKSNSTKLRELAKIFTHALSAYLQDPDTFKKILAEIRPTVPSPQDDDTAFAVTALLPTTLDDYPSVTKEKDEVLDFSDDVTPSKFKRPTTVISSTSTEISTVTDDSGFGYYTTSIPSFEHQYKTTTSSPFTESDEFHSTISHNLSNNFASQVNNAFDVLTDNNGRGKTKIPDAPTFSNTPVDYENYFPSGESAYNNEVGDLQQNPATTYEPYGKYVKPSDSKPIQYDNNYEQSSTPSSYEQTLPPVNHENNNKNAFDQLKEKFDESISSSLEENSNVPTTTGEPFRIQYFDQGPTTTQPRNNNEETLVTANSINSNYKNINSDVKNIGVNNRAHLENTHQPSQPFTLPPSSRYTESFQSHRNLDDQNDSTLSQKISSTNNVDNNSNVNDHWTSSPTVTQLWESTVFYDPKHINQGLTSQTANNPSSIEYFDNTLSATTHSSISGNHEILVTDASANNAPLHTENTQNTPTSWQWSTTNTDRDSPTMFTLLPNSYSTDQTATPTPLYTTRSSITTTITSSIMSTSSLPADSDVQKINGAVNNNDAGDRENEITRAKEMFGKLNATSTDTLMKVMKHADENANVRQLVLLLINHCNGPMNKTQEQEKEQLLNALLRTPVNEFTSEESRELIAGISKLNLPIGKINDDLEAKGSSHYVTSPKPAVTTYRNKNLRRVSVNRKPSSTNRTGNSDRRIKSVTETDSTASDERALELLRSLYSVAAKWG